MVIWPRRLRAATSRMLAAVLSGVVIAGGALAAPAPSAAAPTTSTLNLNFQELVLDYSSHVDYPASGSGVVCTGSNTCTGMADGDKVLFLNTATIAGQGVDVLVTTQLTAGATVTEYMVGTGVTTPGAFKVNTTNGNPGSTSYAAFKFDFYVNGTYGTANQNTVTLQNVQMTGIDIDSNQYNTFSNIQSYTLTNNTILTPSRTDGSTGTFPGTYEFQSSNASSQSGPEAQVVVTFGEVTTTTIPMADSDGGSNFFGIQLKALSFSGQATSTLPVQTLNVAYDLNNGTGTTPTTATGSLGQIITAATGSGFSRPGYTFAGWNTVAGGGGQSASSGGSFTIPNGGATLYAQWTATPYTVTYMDTGSSSGAAPSTQNFTVASPATISGNTGNLDNPGYTFAGWTTTPGGSAIDYAPGSSYGQPANLVLYPVWQSNAPAPAPGPGPAAACTLSFDANGGTGSVGSTSATCGTWVPVNPGTVSRSGFTFAGWGTSPSGGTVYPVGSSLCLLADATLYAQWVPVGATPPTPSTPVTPGFQPVEEVTDLDTPVTVDPLATNPPPPGDSWDPSTLRLVDPKTGKTGTKVTTRDGTWTLDVGTSRVTFTPAPGFVGTERVKFEVRARSLTLFETYISVTVLGKDMRAKDLRKITRTIYFDVRSPKLTIAAKRTLDAMIRTVRSRGTAVKGSVVGYVQPEPYRGNDFTLSTARAKSVRSYLLTEGRFPSLTPWKGLGRADQPDWMARRATATVWYVPKR